MNCELKVGDEVVLSENYKEHITQDHYKRLENSFECQPYKILAINTDYDFVHPVYLIETPNDGKLEVNANLVKKAS